MQLACRCAATVQSRIGTCTTRTLIRAQPACTSTDTPAISQHVPCCTLDFYLIHQRQLPTTRQQYSTRQYKLSRRQVLGRPLLLLLLVLLEPQAPLLVRRLLVLRPRPLTVLAPAVLLMWCKPSRCRLHLKACAVVGWVHTVRACAPAGVNTMKIVRLVPNTRNTMLCRRQTVLPPHLS